MIIGENLKNILVDNKHNIIAKKLLTLETSEPNWISNLDYIDIAVEDPTKISYVSLDRKERFVKQEFKGYKFKNPNITFRTTNNHDNTCGLVWKPSNTEHNSDVNYVSCICVDTPEKTNWILETKKIKYWNLIKKELLFSTVYDFWNKNLRVIYCYMTSPGRFISKLNMNFSQKDLDEFNRCFYKSDLALNTAGVYFKLVKGNDIAKYYNERTYHSDSGTLGSSCMRYSSCQDYFEVYTKNENKVNMLVLFNCKTDKVCGRAIIWYGEDYTLMDRIYTNDSKHEEFFKHYAMRNKWWFKEQQCNSNSNFYNPDTNKFENNDFEIELDDLYDDIYYPYMDTMQYGMFKRNKLLLNSYRDEDYRFCETDGGPCISPNTVWSEYHDEELDEDDAVYSEHYQSYIRYDEAIYIGNDYYHEDSEDIINIKGNWYILEDCIYSDYYDEYLREDIDSIEYAEDINSYIYKDNGIYSDRDDKFYLDENCVFSNYHDSYILKDDAIEYKDDYIHKDDYDDFIENLKEEELEEVE